MKRITLLLMAGVMVIGLSLSANAGKAAKPVLTEAEKSDLIYTREEEKLARDVYLALYDTWGAVIFSNIAASENTHTGKILTLLNTYGVPDPAVGLAIGEFNNPELQDLYNTLVADGNTSLEAALKVGVAIEELDIADITACLARTNKRDITQVYTNLRAGSYNHLNAFNSQLAALETAYTPNATSLNANCKGNGNGDGICDGSGKGKGKGKGKGNGDCDGTGKGNGDCDGTGKGGGNKGK